MFSFYRNWVKIKYLKVSEINQNYYLNFFSSNSRPSIIMSKKEKQPFLLNIFFLTGNLRTYVFCNERPIHTSLIVLYFLMYINYSLDTKDYTIMMIISLWYWNRKCFYYFIPRIISCNDNQLSSRRSGFFSNKNNLIDFRLVVE